MLSQYQRAMEIARMGIWEWDIPKNMIFWGDEKFKMFGYEPNEFELNLETAFKTVHTEDQAHIFKVLEENLSINDIFEYEYRGIKKNNDVIYVWVRVTVERDIAGNATKVKGISQDITNRKNLENKISNWNETLEKEVQERTEKLEKINKENVLLIKEMHHRVKNNLQVISSILHLQQHYIDDEFTKNVLAQCVRRIKSIALIHDSLYSQSDLQEIELSTYIRRLIDLHVNEDENISAVIDIEHYTLPVNKMLPVGMIINELISNSIKHGFTSQSKGEISISISKSNTFIINYSDNGKGFDLSAKKESASFGMVLIETLSADLNGNYFFETDPGKGLKFHLSTEDL